jgi:hypothetical protein
LMGLLSHKRNSGQRMFLCEWKVKGEIASVFIMNYHSKWWISVSIAGCYITGRQTQTAAGENRPSRTCAFSSLFFKSVHDDRMQLCTCN